MPDPVLVEQFADLFRGNSIARDNEHGFRPWENPTGGYYPASGASFQNAVQAHLSVADAAIGVYPVFAIEEPQGGSEAHCVWWGCVDWDQGDTDSWIHAQNTQRVLTQLNVPSWIERSRSKGYHLWVFFADMMGATEIRHGLMGACNIVAAPTQEVNPKQVTLTGKGIGNGVRLPYPYGAGVVSPRNVVVEGTFDSPIILPLQEFVERAHATRIDTHLWEQVRELYRAPVKHRIDRIDFKRSSRTPTYLTGPAGIVRREGPQAKPGKPDGDRSGTLYHLACLMVRQGHEPAEVLSEIIDADKDWGGKFTKRPDGETRLRELVESAVTRIRQEKAQIL